MSWPERLLSMCILTPAYSVTLLGVATVAGRYAFFRPFVIRMWSRLPGAGKVVAAILK